MNNKPILAFDCATLGASISLRTADGTATRHLAQGKQAAELIPAIDTLVREAGVAYGDLGLIVTTVGPGSFTGLRIGLAALHGFVLVTKTPIRTLTTLEAMAWHVARMAEAPVHFVVAIRAGKGEVYAQEFLIKNGAPHAVAEIFLAPEGQTEWAAMCFSNMLAPEAPHYLAGPHTETMCSIASDLPETTLASALPLYVRAPDAAIPKSAAWLA